MNENKKLPYTSKAIVEVVFGERTPQSIQREVRDALRKSDVRYKQVVRERRKFALKVVDL